MKEETTLFEKDNIKITNLRAVFGEKTYAVSNITAVEKETNARSALPPLIAVAGGITLLFVVGGALSSGDPLNFTALFIGIALLVIGILVVRSERDSYTVKISTASGEIKAFVSSDTAFIKQIVDALNTAIVQKG